MKRNPLGDTGLEVSALGLGCGPLGDHALDETTVDRLLSIACDLGVNVFDTAPSYGASEERLGRFFSKDRRDVVLVTKGGYGVPGAPDWSAECIAGGVDRALSRLRVESLGVFLLHSCDEGTVRRDDLWEPLVRAKRAGKVRAIGYSGDGPALSASLETGLVDVVECSVNLLDRSGLDRVRGAGVGVLAKRVLGNAAWSPRAAVGRPDVDEYKRRSRLLFGDATSACGLGLDELFLRFAAHADGVSSALLGTSRPEALDDAVRLVARGPLSASVASELSLGYAPHAVGFFGLV